jgi:hypothetical protein
VARGTDPRIELRVTRGTLIRRDGRSLRASDLFDAPAREAWDLIREGFALPASGAADEAIETWLAAQAAEVRELPHAPFAVTRHVSIEVVRERDRRDVGDEAFEVEAARQRQHMPPLPPGCLYELCARR